MKLKFLKLFLIFCIIAPNISGCFNYNEIRDYANVAGIAIDKGEEGKKYKLTMEVIVFGSAFEFKIEVFIIESEGDTIFEAIRNSISVANKKLYLGHCKVIIISEDVAKEDIGGLLDIFIRDHEFRLTLIILIAKGEKANKMLFKTTIPSQIASYEMEKLVQNDKKHGANAEYKLLYQIESDILSEGIELTVPTIELVELEDRKSFKIAGIACFKDEKLFDFIDQSLVKYYLILTNNYEGGLLKVQFDSDIYLGFEVKKLKTSFKFQVQENKIIINAKIDVNTTIGENTMTPKKNFITEAKANKQFSESLKEELEKEFKRVQTEIGLDIYGFEKRFREDYYRKWQTYKKDNQDFIKNVSLNVEVKVKIMSSGLIGPGD